MRRHPRVADPPWRKDGEPVRQPYPTDTSPLDILAVRKDRQRLLAFELKHGRGSGRGVGHILWYMWAM